MTAGFGHSRPDADGGFGGESAMRVVEVFCGRVLMLHAVIVLLVLCCTGTNAYAIPSPELVIGSISSLSQVATLVMALFGGGAVAIGARAGLKRNGGNGSGRVAMRIALCLFAACVALAGLNGYQYIKNSEGLTTRLQATLVRPSRLPGSKILDPNLKQISFSEQQSHPMGISTGDAAALLASGEATFLDIRETGENQMGSLPGARHVRFPDFAASGIDVTSKTAILLCHNGNRSFETCERLAAMGIDCRFIRGGIEKWIVEGRPFTDPKVRTLSDLRALPDYPGSAVLLGTRDAADLIKDQGATIVDVRYPGAFAIQHLPGSINIPIRAMPSAELASQISNLPKKPVFAACYDRRSCFSSQVLGLELSKAGYDFRGRYTLPWEYFEAKTAKPHISAWLAEQQRGPWQQAIDMVASWLGNLAGKTGLVAAIFIAALISRLMVLPISIKAERDQIAMRASGDELKDLKAKLKQDPKRMAQALKAFYARHGMTPMRNLLALAFLPLMMVTLSAVEKAAAGIDGGMLWVTSLAAPDGLYIIPVLFGALAGVYLDVAFVKKRWHRTVVWLLGAPLLAAIAAVLSAAGGIYLIASVGLLLMQRAWVTQSPAAMFALPKAIANRWRQWRVRDGIVPLAFHGQLAGSGNKSVRLAELRQHGVPVPDGFVLTGDFLQSLKRYSPEGRQQVLARAFKQFGSEQVAVRSSAAGEDGNEKSFAGVFDSVLHVGADEFCQAVDKVEASFGSVRSASYSVEGGCGNILVQQMVDADYAGVLFTRDPVSPGVMLLEMVEGVAEDLVSGLATPISLRLGRGSHALLSGPQPAIDVSRLLTIGRQCEAIFGNPQDIEWVYKDGQFQIVQTRDITAPVGGREAVVEEEWGKLLQSASDGDGDEIVLQQDAMSEVLPQPTPYSLSFMEQLWASGGSVDLACRQLGLSYPVGEDAPTQLMSVFGRLYTDPRIEKANAATMPGLTAKRLRKRPQRIAEEFETNFLPAFLDEVAVLEAIDFGKLSQSKLFELADTTARDFATYTHVQVEVINIAASFYMHEARKQLDAAGLNAAEWLAAGSDAGPEMAIMNAHGLPRNGREAAFLAAIGHRSVFDYELSAPRYCEDLAGLSAYCAAFAGKPHGQYNQAGAEPDLDELDLEVRRAVETARRYQVMKETAKDQSLRQMSVLRSVLLALDESLELRGGIFYLTPEEISTLGEKEPEYFAELIQHRKVRRALLLEEAPLPATLTRQQLEAASLPDGPGDTASDGIVAGNRVAGSGTVFGRARVVSAALCETGAAIEGFCDGDILVCKMVHPAWLPYVLRAGGVVCEVGGWLSHMAIVAREHNIAMIAGARGIASIYDEAPVKLLPSGQVDVLETNTGEMTEAGMAMTG